MALAGSPGFIRLDGEVDVHQAMWGAYRWRRIGSRPPRWPHPCRVEEATEAEAIRGEGSDERGGSREWCQDGLAVFRLVDEELDTGGLVFEGRVDDEDLPGRAVAA